MPDSQTENMQLDEKQATSQKAERVLSVDVLRGFDMFWIAAGEEIFHTLAAATGWQFFKVMSTQLQHVRWEGFHFYDLIFPLFMFITGITTPFALIGRLEKGTPKSALYRKVIIRFCVLFILGLIYNQGWHQNWANPCIASVLGQLGFGYLFASLILLRTHKLRWIITWAAGILIGVALIQFLVPVPGYGAGVFTPRGSVNAYLDRLLMPGDFWFYMTPDGTMYELAEPMPANARPLSEALGILNWISGTGIVLMGVAAGLILKKRSIPQYRKVTIYLASGIGCLLTALCLKPWYPIIKNIQTSTFYLFAGGFCFLLFGLFYLVIDVWKVQRWGFFFQVIGVNAITVYLGYQLIDVNYTSRVLVGGLTMYMGAYGPVIISIVTEALLWSSLYLLYRKKVFLRV